MSTVENVSNLARAVLEIDEARATVEDELRTRTCPDQCCCPDQCQGCPYEEDERDEARAEVERLKALLRDVRDHDTCSATPGPCCEIHRRQIDAALGDE